MIVGDSLMYDSTPGIYGALDATGSVEIFQAAIRGFGLNRPYPWGTEWPRLLADWNPDVVVMMEGGWDTPLRKLIGPVEYQKLVVRAAETLTKSGAHLLWMELPEARVSKSEKLINRSFNYEFSRLPELLPGKVTFVPTEHAMDPDGIFRVSRTVDGVKLRIRKFDGAHICPAGAAVIGMVVYQAIGERFVLGPQRANWRSDDWHNDPRYNDPDQACTLEPWPSDPPE